MDKEIEKRIVSERISIENCLPDISTDNIREEILSGFTANQKYISSKYFYNKEGSLLFEKITELEEYYPTRIEKAIIESNKLEIVKDIAGKAIIELGSGDCSKIGLLLQAVPVKDLDTITYIPVDFSLSAIRDSVKCLKNNFPGLKIEGAAADFLHRLDFIPKQRKKILCFFGSTIGNLSHQEAVNFIKEVSAILIPGDKFILGMDMVKEKEFLEKAYNDSKNITADFNKNIFNTINPIIKTNIDPDNFEHRAFYNEDQNRIEMHLLALENLNFTSPFSDKVIEIRKGESIHTENSHKFTGDDIRKFASSGGLKISNIYTDNPNQWFSLVLFEK